jgi:hypothetical protein
MKKMTKEYNSWSLCLTTVPTSSDNDDLGRATGAAR